MKQFEKWWKKFIPFELHRGDDRNKVKKEYEKAWRAALEWTKNLFVQLNSFEVEETINKELREE